MIDFSAMKKKRTDGIVTSKHLGAINLRIADKSLLMMVREIQDALDNKSLPQTIIESMIVHTYKQLKKDGKI